MRQLRGSQGAVPDCLHANRCAKAYPQFRAPDFVPRSKPHLNGPHVPRGARGRHWRAATGFGPGSLAKQEKERILEPELPIIDTHHLQLY